MTPKERLQKLITELKAGGRVEDAMALEVIMLQNRLLQEVVSNIQLAAINCQKLLKLHPMK